jgi:hypothetical protein
VSELSDDLLRLADDLDVDLDKLDATMRSIAEMESEPNALEKALIKSDLSREDRLRVGILIHLSVTYGIFIDKFRSQLSILSVKGRANRDDLNNLVSLLISLPGGSKDA